MFGLDFLGVGCSSSESGSDAARFFPLGSLVGSLMTIPPAVTAGPERRGL